MSRSCLDWPKRPFEWIEDGTLHISVPFTWNLPDVQSRIMRTWMPVRVGGPAVELMPGFLCGAQVGGALPGVLQRVNPLATRTTYSCPCRCGFCGVGRGMIERGGFRELADFPAGPIVCDNNLLAASPAHLERVVAMLQPFGWADFNQGIDASLVTQEIADLIASIGKPIVRLALDSMAEVPAWEAAYECFRQAGIAKDRLRTYVLIAYESGPDDSWKRCSLVEGRRHGTTLPMWYHPLDALEYNAVTDDQRKLGWTEDERDRIMGYFWKHRGIPMEITA